MKLLLAWPFIDFFTVSLVGIRVSCASKNRLCSVLTTKKFKYHPCLTSILNYMFVYFLSLEFLEVFYSCYMKDSGCFFV